MLRFLSILVLLAGLLVAGYGGARMLELYAPERAMTESAALEKRMVEPAPVEEAYLEDDVMVEALPEADPLPPGPENEIIAETASVPSASRSLPAPALDESMFTTEGVGEARSLDTENHGRHRSRARRHGA